MWILIGIAVFVVFGNQIVAAVTAMFNTTNQTKVGTTPAAPVQYVPAVLDTTVKPKVDILPVAVKDPVLDQIEAVGLWKELRDFFVEHKRTDAVARMDDIFPLLNLADGQEKVTVKAESEGAK